MLWRVASLKGLCRLMQVRGINVRQGTLRITFGQHALVSPEKLLKLLNEHKRTMSFKNGTEPQLLYRMGSLKEKPLTWLERTLPALAAD